MGIRPPSNPTRSLDALIVKAGDRTTNALLAGALVVEATAKELLSQPGLGAIRRGGRERVGKGSFNRGKDGKLHLVTRGRARTKIDVTDRASRPGDPPAPDTGTLRGSITHEIVSRDVVRVGTNVEYAPPLEFGTTRMAPRPFMRPAIVMSSDKVSDEVIAVLRVGHGGQ